MGLVDYELNEHIAVIRLNRPERLNAMAGPMFGELTEAFARFNGDDAAWVGILAGAGRAFCAGRDMKAQAEGFDKPGDRPTARTYTSERNIFGISDTDKPLIAAVHGYAMGLGWYMTMACDVRVAAAGTQFAMAEVPTGVLGPYWMAGAELLPWPIAAEFTLLGERVSADRLFGLGLLNAIVAEDELMSEAHTWAQKFVHLPPRQVQSTKALMRAMRSVPDRDLLAREVQVRNQLIALSDSKEAVLAWQEKREPQFRGS